ncbi:universal stress protein [Nocardioides nanhaiensis]|uniref:Universal stress protein n=1 Tax=Nocardioides nanhaiensis TaxID=1476871 RepID=A0ABP8WCN2_9ACTN
MTTSPHPSTVDAVPAGAVVVALDGSEHAERALTCGAQQAALEHRTLVLAHASGAEIAHATTVLGPALPVPGLAQELHTAAARLLDESAGRVVAEHPDLRVLTVASDDDARRMLLELAREAHLVVLGSRGRGVVRSLVLGSVSAAVARHATCPVVVSRPGGPPAPTAGVLVGVDGGKGSAQVAEVAFRMASFRGLPLTVVHCYWDAVAAYAAAYPGTAADVDNADRLADLSALVSSTLAGLGEKFPDVVVTRRLAHGLVDQVLTEGSQTWDLVVVGRHPRSGWAHLMGHSLSSAVLERARCTVVVVPHDASTTDHP